MKTDALKDALDSIHVIKSSSLPARTIIVSEDIAEILKQLPTK